MSFILGNQFNQLKLAAKSGDEKAREILQAQLDDSDNERLDFLVSEYFKPKVAEPNPIEPEIEMQGISEEENPFDASLVNSGNKKLDKFLIDNKIGPDSEDYDEFVDSYYEMFPEEKTEETPIVENEDIAPEQNGSNNVIEFLLKDENEAIDGYDQAIKAVTNDTTMDEIKKKAYLQTFQHIKEEELEHIKELQELISTDIIKSGVE